MSEPLGHTVWAIPEGYVPSESTAPTPELESHETACLLNTGDEDARVEVTVYFEDREPAGRGPSRGRARRTYRFRFDQEDDPEPIPKDTAYASVIRSDRPIVVQHTRLDSRQAENALLSTIAYPVR